MITTNKKENKKLAVFQKLSKCFNGIMYLDIGGIILLFFAVGMNWILNKEKYANGGGDVIAIMYVGPVIIIDMIAISLFIILAIIALIMRKYDKTMIKQQFGKNRLLFCIEFLTSVVATALLFI